MAALGDNQVFKTGSWFVCCRHLGEVWVKAACSSVNGKSWMCLVRRVILFLSDYVCFLKVAKSLIKIATKHANKFK